MKTQEAPISSVRIVSLGCAKNLVDTEIAAAALLIRGFAFTDDEKEADLLFINTCAFLASARKEAEAEIIHAEAWKKRRAGRKIIVAGCIVSWDTDGAFRAKHPEVDAWCSIRSVDDIGRIAAETIGKNGGGCFFDGGGKPYLYSHATPRLQLTPPHYAYLKIADGCDNRCTYCKIPDIRGPLRSRTVEDVIKEAENLLKNGVRELIVIAQDTSAFGRDRYGKPKLAELLDGLDRFDGEYLIRLMYLHPASINDELLSAMARCKHLIRCLEIPIQHVSDRILKAMHRKIGGEETKAVIRKLRFDLGFDLRTTFMLGFPGETDEDFRELLDFVREIRFTRLGAFVFSPEDGVPAAAMPGRPSARVAGKRLKELMELQAGISLEANNALTGREADVIVDEILPRGKAAGRLFADAPEIDNTVRVKGLKKGEAQVGDFIKIRVESAAEYEISGTILRGGESA